MQICYIRKHDINANKYHGKPIIVIVLKYVNDIIEVNNEKFI